MIGLELEALIKEHEETMANIYRYEDILEHRDAMAQVIMNELEAIRREYGRTRRTLVENGEEAVYEEKKLEEMEVMCLVDRFGYVRTIDTAAYERNKEAADSENKYVFPARNTGRICIFTNMGQLHTIKVADLPFGKFRDKGIPLDNVSNYSSEKESIVLVTSQSQLNLYRVIFATRMAMLKIVDGGQFDVTKRTVGATRLQEGDEVVSVVLLKDQCQIVLGTAEGYVLRFSLDEIPEKKKGAIGVRGMKLGSRDYIEAVCYLGSAPEQAMVEYKGKQMEAGRLKLGKRDTKGVRVKL